LDTDISSSACPDQNYEICRLRTVRACRRRWTWPHPVIGPRAAIPSPSGVRPRQFCGASKRASNDAGVMHPRPAPTACADVDNRHKDTIVSINDTMTQPPHLLSRRLDQLVLRQAITQV